MKLKFIWISLMSAMLILSGCEDKEIPIETTSEDTNSAQSESNQKDIDDHLEEERDKINQYMNINMNDAIEHHNKAMEAIDKAQNMDIEKEQYEVFINEVLPEAKKALRDAKSLKANSNPKDLDQLEEKLVKPLNTFVNLLEYKGELMKTKSEQKKKELEKVYEEHVKKYMEELKSYYDKLEAIKKKYNLDFNLDNINVLKEQIKRTIEIAEYLKVSSKHLKELIAFQQEALNALHALIKNQSTSGNKLTEKFTESLFPELEKILDRDRTQNLNPEKLSESIDQLKEATENNLEALEMRKKGIDNNNTELIEKSREKYKEYEEKIDEFRSNLEDAKSKIDDIKNRAE
ncbi:V-type ATP synthase subunit I domain-containing protein [Virgibacillus alimentarius]|uniref:hypothetical protein n=1 Tax=Virgibacillus alimentarius TaxID=698769 RepID=UPI0004939FE4|nr:hypothetical protein [Virgibacillus alimentarius]